MQPKLPVTKGVIFSTLLKLNLSFPTWNGDVHGGSDEDEDDGDEEVTTILPAIASIF
jgi:hypothetical protein